MTLQQDYDLLKLHYTNQIDTAKETIAHLTRIIDKELDLTKVLNLTFDRVRQNEIIRELNISLENLK